MSRKGWLLAATLILWLPVLLILLAHGLAAALGCRLEMAGARLCEVAARDAGPVLYFLFALGWAGLPAVPLMLLSLAGWALWGTARLLRRWRRG